MRRWREWSRKRRAVIIAMAAVVGAGVVVAATDDPRRSADEAASLHPAAGHASAGQAAAVDSTSAAAVGGGGSGDSSGVLPVTPPPVEPAPIPDAGGQQVVRTGRLDLEVRRGSFREAFRAASEVAAAHGGFVAGSSSTSTDERTSAGSLSLRIPGDRFDAAMRALSALGKVKGEHLSGTDVGGQLVDLGARVASARVQEDALRALMGRANTVGETLQVQEQLGRVRQEIEQLTAQQARLRDQVAMASIEVQLAEPGAAPTRPEDPSALGRSFERAADGALAVAGGTIVVLGYLLPLVVVGLLAWIVARVGGSVSRRRTPAPTAG